VTRDLDEGNLILSDLVNRVLDTGVVISGHVLISIADIDLVALDLKLLITSIETAARVIPSEARDLFLPEADPSRGSG
jgi:hypothetical protein